jgi:hypothetical protein
VPFRTLAILLAVQLALGAAFVAWAASGFPLIDRGKARGAAESSAPTPTAHRFDGSRAFAELRAQVAMGPRPAGSPPSRRLASRLRARLPNGHFEPVGGGLRNVVGTLPGRRPAVVVAAHYDTKDIPGFVGAEDGAGGTAAVLELARVLSRKRARDGPELRFVLFDGEESPRGSSDFLRDGDRGSRAYVRAHRGEVGEMILLDFIADRHLSLPREAGSDPGLWSRLRAAARRVGVARVFPNRTRAVVEDDHTPFAAAGIPAIDLIDFDYPYWHTIADTPDKLSVRSLDASGEAVLELLSPARRTGGA